MNSEITEASGGQVGELRRQAALYTLSMLDTEPEEEFDRIARLAQRLLATTSAVVSFMDHDRQWYKARAGVTTTQAERSTTFCTHTIASGAPLLIGDASQHPNFRDNPHVKAGSVRFYAGVPIHSPGGYAVGTLCVWDPVPRQASLNDLEPLLDLTRMVEDIIAGRIAATTDHLTGIQNREGFIKAAVPLLGLVDRVKMTMTVGFFDINGLKGINDRFGHGAGDKAIASTARVLKGCFRAADVLGRLGGDEFAVLFADTGKDGAAAAARRFEEALTAHAEPELPFAISVAAGFVARRPGGPPLDAILLRADAVMYARKRDAGEL